MIFYYDLLWKRTLQIKNFWEARSGGCLFFSYFWIVYQGYFHPIGVLHIIFARITKFLPTLMVQCNWCHLSSWRKHAVSLSREHFNLPHLPKTSTFKKYDQDIYGYGLMLLPCQILQSSFLRKEKVKDGVFKPGSVSSASSRKFPAGLEWHSEKQTWVGF